MSAPPQTPELPSSVAGALIRCSARFGDRPGQLEMGEITILRLRLRPLRFPHSNRRGLLLDIGRLSVGLHLWWGFWPTLTYYRVNEAGGHNLRFGPVLVGWGWRRKRPGSATTNLKP